MHHLRQLLIYYFETDRQVVFFFKAVSLNNSEILFNNLTSLFCQLINECYVQEKKKKGTQVLEIPNLVFNMHRLLTISSS